MSLLSNQVVEEVACEFEVNHVQTQIIVKPWDLAVNIIPVEQSGRIDSRLASELQWLNLSNISKKNPIDEREWGRKKMMAPKYTIQQLNTSSEEVKIEDRPFHVLLSHGQLAQTLDAVFQKQTDRNDIKYGKDEIGKKVMRRLVHTVVHEFKDFFNNKPELEPQNALIEFLVEQAHCERQKLTQYQLRQAKIILYPLPLKRKDPDKQEINKRHTLLKKATKRELIIFFKTYIGRQVFWEAFRDVFIEISESEEIADADKYRVYVEKIQRDIED